MTSLPIDEFLSDLRTALELFESDPCDAHFEHVQTVCWNIESFVEMELDCEE